MREARDWSENNNGEHQEVLVSFLLSRGPPSETTSAIGRIARSLTQAGVCIVCATQTTMATSGNRSLDDRAPAPYLLED
jgi:hypothetical protein